MFWSKVTSPHFSSGTPPIPTMLPRHPQWFPKPSFQQFKMALVHLLPLGHSSPYHMYHATSTHRGFPNPVLNNFNGLVNLENHKRNKQTNRTNNRTSLTKKDDKQTITCSKCVTHYQQCNNFHVQETSYPHPWHSIWRKTLNADQYSWTFADICQFLMGVVYRYVNILSLHSDILRRISIYVC